MKESLITPAGLTRISEELDRLKSTGRLELAERIRQAIATDADVTANADYLAAREELVRLEERIATLEERLAAARVVDADPENDVVDLGERVRLRDLDTGSRHEYQLVGSLEADPESGRISSESPLGRALLGRRRGEVALVDTPRGQFRYRIVAVEPPLVAA